MFSLCSTVTRSCFMLQARKHFVLNTKWICNNEIEQVPPANLLPIKNPGEAFFKDKKRFTPFLRKQALIRYLDTGCWKSPSFCKKAAKTRCWSTSWNFISKLVYSIKKNKLKYVYRNNSASLTVKRFLTSNFMDWSCPLIYKNLKQLKKM